MWDRIVSATSKKYFSMPMFGAGRVTRPVARVRARRPHEVAAVGVDVVGELDALVRVRDPVLVADLRLGGLERPGERLARAGRARAGEAVEERADRVVAVEVDAPRVAVGHVVARRGRRAVVRQVLALHAVVVERGVAAVRVRDREDEDVELVDVLLGRRVRRVVADQPLGGLQAGDRRDPLTRVLLAVQVDADRVVGAVLADPVHLLLERAADDVARVRADERRRGGGEAAGPVDRAAAHVVRELDLRRRVVRPAGRARRRPGTCAPRSPRRRPCRRCRGTSWRSPARSRPDRR